MGNDLEGQQAHRRYRIHLLSGVQDLMVTMDFALTGLDRNSSVRSEIGESTSGEVKQMFLGRFRKEDSE